MASLSPPVTVTRAAAGIDELRLNVARRRRWDIVFAAVGLLATSVGVITLLALFVDLLLDGYHRLTPEFFLSYPSRRADQAGILSAWVGTCLVMLVTAAVGVPLSVCAGVYLEEYAPRNWVTALIEINVSNLAAVPSIVYGLLALGLFVYALNFGQSILSAGLTLALMIMPIIVVATREAIRAIPHTIREAAYAVGATRWQVTRDHVLPYAIPGIATGVIIGLARAIGETAPLVTIGALTFIAYLPDPPFTSTPPFVSFDWLWSGFTVLPIQMFNWVSRPGTAFHANAAAAGIVIVVLTLVMNGFAIWLRYRLRQRITW
ncbi:MAG: phosphate ABC transporter permease PstA [Geminicoccaceae bacterium]|nr:phosphate ABC transporter permease PstA [Geminicoccaceae bacterium]MCS7266568.1 phosphate ABC transporter permease PstA [Geminicoccaceae bacterium]MDW8123201.1 phosphate ABC transporter permease PstA [Geminicoccaceae bacterium]MDW8340139.1 phosphate ABC transporter permease PstA [Geminicoccaceae bacterium]